MNCGEANEEDCKSGGGVIGDIKHCQQEAGKVITMIRMTSNIGNLPGYTIQVNTPHRTLF